MNWKKALLIGLGWGVGTALGLAILVGGFLRYQSKPKPPKPWDSKSIKAEYDHVTTEGDDNHVVIYYVLENTTDFDYRVTDAYNVRMSAKLEDQNSLRAFSENEKIDYPVSVPARKRVSFLIHLMYPYPSKMNANADLDERKKYRQTLEKYMAEQWANLDGFDFLDESSRNEIIFPAGWKHSK